MQTIQEKTLRKVRSHGRGWAFTPKDLSDVTTRGALSRALADLTESGLIRRVARGVYDFPRINPKLGGELSPDIDQLAQALARKYRWTIVPEPALAANLLGLSQQVPAQTTYLSDGPTKSVKLGTRTIHFKHARPKSLDAETPVGSLAVQALRYLGKSGVNSQTIRALRNALSAEDRRRLLRDTSYAAQWIHAAAQKIAEGD